jgi:hypothetical protein
VASYSQEKCILAFLILTNSEFSNLFSSGRHLRYLFTVAQVSSIIRWISLFLILESSESLEE